MNEYWHIFADGSIFLHSNLKVLFPFPEEAKADIFAFSSGYSSMKANFATFVEKSPNYYLIQKLNSYYFCFVYDSSKKTSCFSTKKPRDIWKLVKTLLTVIVLSKNYFLTLYRYALQSREFRLSREKKKSPIRAKTRP